MKVARSTSFDQMYYITRQCMDQSFLVGCAFRLMHHVCYPCSIEQHTVHRRAILEHACMFRPVCRLTAARSRTLCRNNLINRLCIDQPVVVGYAIKVSRLKQWVLYGKGLYLNMHAIDPDSFSRKKVTLINVT
jgi:hypothetical protein